MPHGLNEWSNGLAAWICCGLASLGVRVALNFAHVADLLFVAEQHHLHGCRHGVKIEIVCLAVSQHRFHTIVVGNNDKAPAGLVGKSIEVLHPDVLETQLSCRGRSHSAVVSTVAVVARHELLGNLTGLLLPNGISHHHHRCGKNKQCDE